MDNRQSKKGTDKKKKKSMSSSRSNDDSKERSLGETTADANDGEYQADEDRNEQQTIQSKKVKNSNGPPKKDLGYLNNGFSLRKMNFQSLVKSHIERIRRDNE